MSNTAQFETVYIDWGFIRKYKWLYAEKFQMVVERIRSS